MLPCQGCDARGIEMTSAESGIGWSHLERLAMAVSPQGCTSTRGVLLHGWLEQRLAEYACQSPPRGVLLHEWLEQRPAEYACQSPPRGVLLHEWLEQRPTEYVCQPPPWGVLLHEWRELRPAEYTYQSPPRGVRVLDRLERRHGSWSPHWGALVVHHRENVAGIG
eukprot:553908-Amphidinium_carterae.1